MYDGLECFSTSLPMVNGAIVMYAHKFERLIGRLGFYARGGGCAWQARVMDCELQSNPINISVQV